MKITKDTVTGLMFLALGLGALFMALQYRLGTLTAMGPGYFPVMLSCLVALCGAIMTVRSAIAPDPERVLTEFHIKPLAIIVVAVLIFGLTIDRFGLVAAIAALILISQLAMRKKGIVEPIVIFAVLTVIAILVFVTGLNIPLKLGPW